MSITGSAIDWRRMGRLSIAYLPGTVVPMAVNLVATAVFTRLLEPREWGLYALSFSLSAAATTIGVHWLDQAILRYLPGQTDTRVIGALFQSVRNATYLLAAMWLLVTGCIVIALRNSSALSYVLAACCMVLAQTLLVPALAIIRSEHRATTHSAVLSVAAVAGLLVGLVLVVQLNYGGDGRLWGQVAGAALVGAFLARSFAKAGRPPGDGRRLKGIGRLARFGLPMALWLAAASLMSVGDRWVLQIYLGAAPVGVYSANYALAAAGGAVLGAPTMMVLHPHLMSAWKEDNSTERSGSRLSEIIEYMLVVGSVAVAVAVFLADPLSQLSLGASYGEGGYLIPVILAGLLLWQVGMYAHKPLEMAEKTSLLAVLAVGTAVLNLLLNFSMVPVLGMSGAALATVICYGVYALGASLMAHPHISWSVRLLRVMLLMVGLAALVWMVRKSFAPPGATWWTLLIGAVMVGAAGLGAGYALLAHGRSRHTRQEELGSGSQTRILR